MWGLFSEVQIGWYSCRILPCELNSNILKPFCGCVWAKLQSRPLGWLLLRARGGSNVRQAKKLHFVTNSRRLVGQIQCCCFSAFFPRLLFPSQHILMVAAGASSSRGHGRGSVGPHHTTGLRRCVVCTGLSVFKRNIPSARAIDPAANGALQSPTPALDPPPRTFTCYGVEQLAYAQAPPPDDARLQQPDVAFMWCLGKSVFLLDSSALGSAPLPETKGRAWVARASPEVPISYRGLSQALTADEFARMPVQSASSHSHSQARPALDTSRASDSASATQRSAPSPSPSQLLQELKPHVQESFRLLYDSIFTVQSHQHFAAVMRQSALSWRAHCSAAHVLQAGHDRACGTLLASLRKLFGAGGS